MDILTKDQRHKAMANIHSKDTSIEVGLRKALWHEGFRYRKNLRTLPGTPDIALTKYKIAIFCDGEFFHGKDWYTIQRPKILKGANGEFWEKKIVRNMERDSEVNKALNFMGWTVIRFWGREIMKNTEECIAVIKDCIFDQTVNRIECSYELPDSLDEDS